MEATSATKKHLFNTTTMNPDKLTTLPDSIRRHILSFLPLQDVIRLKTLSTGWKSVCSTLSHFDFIEPIFTKTLTVDFKDFVYQILLQHKSPEIHKFQLSLHVDRFSLVDISTWITFAVRRNVHELSLAVLSGKLDTLPNCLFTSKNLFVLSLNNIKLKLPPIFKKFCNLKSLTLVSVEFRDDKEAHRLFSSCPLLEDLTIISCYFRNLDVLKFPAPNLRFLKLLGLSRFQEIKISFPGLRQIVYSGRPPSISLETLLSLHDVEFHLTLPPKEGEERVLIEHGVSTILEGLHNVVRLNLEGVCIEFLTGNQDLFSRLPPLYDSLYHLKLELYPDKNQVEVVMLLLRRVPNLQSLSISIKTLTLTNMLQKGRQRQSQGPSTEDILQCLRKVEIKHFGGSESELYLVKFLLASGSVMEEIKINYSQHKQRAKNSRKDINAKVESFTRGSPKVVISFS